MCVAAIQEQLGMMKNGEGGLSIFLGLTGTKEELGLKADNYWIFAENNFDELYVVLNLTCVACSNYWNLRSIWIVFSLIL